jgi:hypothetical protein
MKMASLVEETNCASVIAADTEAQVRVHALWDDRLRKVLFALGGKVTPPGGGSVKGHVIEFKGPRASKIHFKLQDKTDFELAFRSTDPIWIAANSSCPTSAQLAGFTVAHCKNWTLTVENPGKPGVYAYTLWFVDEDGNEYDYDPIIKNIA